MNPEKDTAVLSGESLGFSNNPRMKFKNGDVSLDGAVTDIVQSKEEFDMPNGDLLARAVMGAKWD